MAELRLVAAVLLLGGSGGLRLIDQGGGGDTGRVLLLFVVRPESPALVGDLAGGRGPERPQLVDLDAIGEWSERFADFFRALSPGGQERPVFEHFPRDGRQGAFIAIWLH